VPTVTLIGSVSVNYFGGVALFKIIILFLLLIATATTAQAAKDGSGPEIGKPAPKLYGRTLQDDLYSLQTDKGQIKVINFFWVECHPCREEMPELARLEKEYKNIKFISIHTSLHKSAVEPENVEKFLKILKSAPSNIVLATSKDLGDDFNIIGLPHTMILDENNIVVMNVSGYDKKNMKKLAAALQRISKQ
jgi:thiol-disulfide isomerase/thioredoxin